MCVCVVVECGVREGAITQQNRKRFELYIPAISEKLSEGFIINHKHAAVPTKRTAWWAAAWDLRVCCCLAWSSSLQTHLQYTSYSPLRYMLFSTHISWQCKEKHLYLCLFVSVVQFCQQISLHIALQTLLSVFGIILNFSFSVRCRLIFKMCRNNSCRLPLMLNLANLFIYFRKNEHVNHYVMLLQCFM